MGTAFPASGMSGGGGPAMPSNALPGMSMPSNALPGMTGATGGQMGATGQQGQAAFVGGAPAGFVGQTPGTQQATGMQNRTNQNRGGARGGRGQNANQNQAGGAGNQQQRTIRPQLIVAFSPPRATSDAMAAKLQTRLQTVRKNSAYDGVQIDVQGSRVILRGEVASAQDARMAAMLARLEPGVRKVQNEILVREPAPAVE